MTGLEGFMGTAYEGFPIRLHPPILKDFRCTEGEERAWLSKAATFSLPRA